MRFFYVADFVLKIMALSLLTTCRPPLRSGQKLLVYVSEDFNHKKNIVKEIFVDNFLNNFAKKNHLPKDAQCSETDFALNLTILRFLVFKI